jgi:transcriptional regulator with XRE-family HTH domain
MARAIDELSPRERPERLAEKLCQIRARLNLSQREMLDLVGLGKHHHAFVSMWERGHREPPLMALLRYAQSIGVSTDVLINDDLDLPSDDESTKKPSVKRKKRTRNVK